VRPATPSARAAAAAAALDVTAAAALDRLTAARASGRPCPPVRTLLPAGDTAAAYAVQAAWVAAQTAAGERIVGRKIGLTSPAVQAQLGVDQPDFGTLLSGMDCAPGEPIDTSRLLQPKIEAEVAFVLARDLDGEHIGAEDVLAATGSVAAALEIVDSRIASWDISIVDTIADNASSGLFTLGTERHPAAALDLAACLMTLRRDGDVVSSGSGAACLGHPALAVAWLAATARSCGEPLRAGDIVLSGALGPMVAVLPADHFTAEIGGLGAVTAAFTA
jgi:2-keto-4-pentenoate hydratase